MDHPNPPALTVIGDVGVDVVLGPSTAGRRSALNP
jgi:hypothetical protein